MPEQLRGQGLGPDSSGGTTFQAIGAFAVGSPAEASGPAPAMTGAAAGPLLITALLRRPRGRPDRRSAQKRKCLSHSIGGDQTIKPSFGTLIAMPFWRRQRSPKATGTAMAALLAQGWNGLAWGSPLADFRGRFPKGGKTDSGWWVTGEGAEPFCGVAMAYTQYGFNDRHQLYLVSFIPEAAHRALLAPAVLNALGAPPGMDAVWRIGEVAVEVKAAGVLATVTHRRYG